MRPDQFLTTLSLAAAILTGGAATQAADEPFHPRTQRPGWMRDGVVAASYTVAPDFYRRVGFASAEANAKWKAFQNEANFRRLKQLGINIVVLPFFYGAGFKAEAANIEATRRMAEMAHRQGLRVSGYIGKSLWYESLFQEEPEARDWIQVDEWGRPLYYTNEQTFRYVSCHNNPGYLAYLKKVFRMGVVDLKLDLFNLDHLEWRPEPNTCHCKYCAAEFRKFLARRYADPRLAVERFGFARLDDLAPPPYNLPAGGAIGFPELRNPLMQEWALFRAENSARRYAEWDTYIGQLNPEAGIVGNPTINVNSNVAFIYGTDPQQVLQSGDGFFSEEAALAHWSSDDRLVNKIRTYKIARLMGKPLWRWQDLGAWDEYQKRPIVLRLAESLAYNDRNLGVLGGLDALEAETRPEVRKFVDFFWSRASELTATHMVADVAVLRSFASTQFNPSRSNFATVLFEQSLIQSKVPFGIIFDRNLGELSRYKVLVLADQDALSDAQLESIRAFVRNGGGLVATGNSSLLTEWRLRRRKFGLSDLFGLDSPPEGNQPVRREFGRGRVVYVPRIEAATANPPAVMISTIPIDLWRLPKNSAELMDAVRWAAAGGLSVDVKGPDWVTMELARRDEPGGRSTLLLHLINYKIEEPAADVSFEIRIPAGQRLREVVFDSPDVRAGSPLAVDVKGAVATVRVPKLDVYGLVLLRLEKP